MKKTLIALTCSSALFSGCQTITETETVTKTKYSDLWTSAEVAADSSIQTQMPEINNPDTDPNRILTSKTQSGNREYLFADSIKQENGMVMALIEYRYAQPQKLPSNGLTYTHNHWFEQIDCANSLRTIRTTTHYNAQGEIVDANEYPIAKFTPEQIKLLAQPNDGVIKEVCQRIGMNVGKVVAPAVSASNVAVPSAMQDVNSQQPEKNSDNSISGNKVADTPVKTEVKSKPQSESLNNIPTQSIKQTTKNKKDEAPVKNKIDFINQDKSDVRPAVSQLPEISEEDLHRPALPADAPDEFSADKLADESKSSKQFDDLPPDFWEIGTPMQK